MWPYLCYSQIRFRINVNKRKCKIFWVFPSVQFHRYHNFNIFPLNLISLLIIVFLLLYLQWILFYRSFKSQVSEWNQQKFISYFLYIRLSSIIFYLFQGRYGKHLCTVIIDNTYVKNLPYCIFCHTSLHTGWHGVAIFPSGPGFDSRPKKLSFL